MKSGARILIVQDEPLVGNLLAMEVERMGFRALGPAVDVSSARALLRTGRPDAVLVDYDLGAGGSSQALAEEVRRVWRVPVVLVSGHVGEADFERAVASIAPDGVLGKPVDMGLLGKMLAHALGSRGTGESESPASQLTEGVLTTDLAGITRSVNPAAARLLGMPASECPGRAIDDLVELIDPAGERVQLTRWARAMGKDVSTGLLDLALPGGRRQPVKIHFGLARSAAGGLTGMTVVLTPVEPPPDHEQSSSEGWRWLEAQDDAPVVVLAPDECVVYVHAVASSLLGLDGPAMVSRSWDAVLADAGWSLAGSARSGKQSAVFSLQRGDGGRLAGQVLPFDNGHLVFLRDASREDEEKRAEDRARRLEDLGYLARGYSHELNNRLTAILGGLSRVESHLAGQGGHWQEDLESVRQAAAEAAGFVRQIGVFSRGGKPIRRPIDLAVWLKGVWPRLPRRPGATYQWTIEDGLPPLLVDALQLERALDNLFRNSNAALSIPGGRVGLQVTASGSGSRRAIDIRVEDNGHGVDENLLPHLTEPYFTTRSAENATGLGLTICDAIARAHGGHLEIQSRPGQSTTATLRFPVSSPDSPSPAKTTPKLESGAPPVSLEPAASLSHSPLRVLVLEDEAMVRKAVSFVLRRAGWEVRETEVGEETIAAWEDARANGRPFHVIVSDLTIRGGMGGVETIRRLLALDPKLKAVACSGYSDDPVMEDPRRFGFHSALPKPFDPPDLIEAVKAAVASNENQMVR
ncbi:MAG: response regulator [Verrucomicrobiales bacterium]